MAVVTATGILRYPLCPHTFFTQDNGFVGEGRPQQAHSERNALEEHPS